MNMKKYIYMTILLMSTMITLSSNNWIGMWMGMEINLMSFIPLMISHQDKKASQSMMIYFLTQSISSICMLFAILMNKFIMYNSYEQVSQLILIISLMIKLGSAPFHMWLPEIMSNLNWTNNMLLMTWQKIAPMTILSNNINFQMIFLFIFLSTGVGAIGALNQTSLRKIMAYSSINHLGWMMMLMMMENTWMIYLSIYAMIIAMIFIMLMKKNILFMNQMNSNKMTTLEKITMASLMMSMGGLPPFTGFLPKWMTIQSMMNAKMWIMMTFMIFMSLITLFYYLRMMYPLIMNYSTKMKWMNQNINNKMTISILSGNILLPIMLLIPVF
uniref:NADH-ubiquinone oxidoreductase chain 2 n=1 Tax=Pyrrhopeplus carduelis TaxID=1928078 RepID=A0A4Y1JVN8_9HEMI|nr:NADH dehydrogenase subunit 2 [Pyrrhopeplus carduelis]APO08806.1 NADH dehydrogenase subunit 2 [Pyrrhopeplus carduelis]